MTGIFNAIKDFFAMIGGIFEFIFKALRMLFTLLTTGMSMLIDLLGMLPTVFLGGGIALVVVCVLYKVLGRENQS